MKLKSSKARREHKFTPDQSITVQFPIFVLTVHQSVSDARDVIFLRATRALSLLFWILLPSDCSCHLFSSAPETCYKIIHILVALLSHFFSQLYTKQSVSGLNTNGPNHPSPPASCCCHASPSCQCRARRFSQRPCCPPGKHERPSFSMPNDVPSRQYDIGLRLQSILRLRIDHRNRASIMHVLSCFG